MMVRVLAALGVGIWCFLLLFASLGMIIDRGLADVSIAWVGLLGIGVGAPVLLLWQVNRTIAAHEASRRAVPDEREKEKEILKALEQRGEITPVTAAISTSLTADEAARMLDGLTSKGYVQLQVEGGLQTYTLADRNTGGLPLAERTYDALPQPPGADLSERELEVLALLASGRTNAEIASDLFVAVGTVKSHVNNIYTKLEVRNRAEAVTRARELELLP